MKQRKVTEMWAIAYIDATNTFNYFTKLGFLNMPEWVGESRKDEARKFYTAYEAQRFCKEHIGAVGRKYRIVSI